jgi:hypothetical protein
MTFRTMFQNDSLHFGATIAAAIVFAAGIARGGPVPGELYVSRSTYVGTASTVTAGQTLPGGGTAISNGLYPTVFNNNTVDGSFGVTSPIFIDVLSRQGALQGTYNVPTSSMVTSFSSKSELALDVSTDGKSITFMGYASPTNRLDVSNSNTPGVIEPGNPVTNFANFRTVGQLKIGGGFEATTTNAYPGNNGRAAIYDAANNQYLTVGNAGNGNGSAAVTAATGVQIVTPGVNATAATPGTIKVGNFNITQYGYKPDKSAKDNNFRGETIFNNTLYVTKGSGGNGIDTVYQVGNPGTLPTAATAAGAPITILPGFPKGLAKTNPDNFYPFGLFFANATTLYVGDEGDGVLNHAATDPNAGLEKWSLVNGTWQRDYTLQAGLQLGVPYNVAGYPTGNNPVTGLPWSPETDGLRNISGVVNGDGTVTIYAITSTVSGSGDQGADPNRLVAITDTLSFATAAQAAGEQFTTLETAADGDVLRGVAFVVTPEPATVSMLGIGTVCLLGYAIRRRASKR